MRRKLFKTMFSVALAVCLMGNTVSASELGTTETEEVSEPVMEDSEAETVDVSAGDAAQESAVEEYTEEIPVEGATTGLTYTVEGDTVTITGEGERWTDGSELQTAIKNAKHVVFRDCKIQGSMCQAFANSYDLQSIDLAGLDASEVTDMSWMFFGCFSLANLDLSSVNTSSVTDMGAMFGCCSGLISLDVSGVDTSRVTNMAQMFSSCSSLTGLDVSNFNTSKVTFMPYMFKNCSSLTSLNVSSFDTSNVTNMTGMFSSCGALMSLDVTGVDTSNVTEMKIYESDEGIFQNCTNLKILDLSSFDLSKVSAEDAGLQNMLSGCSLEELRTPKALPAGCSIALDKTYQNSDGMKTEVLTPEFVGTTLTLYNQVDEQFTDVPTGAWYVSAVQYAYDNGIMTGKTATNFVPNANLTRAEFATVLYSQAGKPAVTYRPIFKDVAQGAWYSSSVLWAYDNGIVSGYANGSFGTSDKITREQLALMMYKYAQTKGYDTTADDSILSSFSDEAAISSWARKAIQWATSHGIMSGKGNGADGKPMLDPKGNATRAECAAMIKKLFTME